MECRLIEPSSTANKLNLVKLIFGDLLKFSSWQNYE